jgi:small subunit ribosomal protein S6
MVNQYETVFILTPVLSENQIKETVDYFRKIITDNGGELVHEEDWGLRKLAYPIQKKTTGYYHLFEFKAPGDVIEKLELEYRRSEKIMRFLTVKLDKYGIEYNERRRKKMQEKQNESKN